MLKKYLPPSEIGEALEIVTAVERFLPNEKSQLYTAVYVTDAARFFKDKYNDSGYLLMKILRIILSLAQYDSTSVDKQLASVINVIEFVSSQRIYDILTDIEEILNINPDVGSYLFSNISLIIQDENNKEKQSPQIMEKYILKLTPFFKLYLQLKHESRIYKNSIDVLLKIQVECFLYSDMMLNILLGSVEKSSEKISTVVSKFLNVCNWMIDEYYDDILAEILEGILSMQIKSQQNCEIEFVDVLENYVNIFDKNLSTRNEFMFVDYVNVINEFVCTS